MEHCTDCRYFSPQPIQKTPADKSGAGFCVRHPPQISDYQVAKYFVEGFRGVELGLKCTWWPAVTISNYCGEYMPKEGDREKRR